MKRTLLVLLLVNLILSACAPAPAPTPTPAPSATPLPTATATPTSTPTPWPTATPVPTDTPTPTPEAGVVAQPDGSFVVVTEKGERLTVPQIEGLTQKVEERNGVETVVFYAEEGNPYGLEAEAYAGEFRPNVIMAEKQTGGLVLDSKVVLSLLNQKLAEIPKQKDRWLVPIPLDIRNSKEPVTIKLSLKEFGGGAETYPSVDISSPEVLPLVNILPDTKEVRIAPSYIGGGYMGYYNPILRIQPYFERIVEGHEMCYLFVLARLNLSGWTTIESSFGDVVDKVSGQMFVSYGLGQEKGPIGPEKVLSSGGVPIFVAANGQ